MEKESKIYVAGHRGLVGSAIWSNLRAKGYGNLLGRTSAELDLRDAAAVERFFEREKPEYVFLAAARVGGIVANNTYRADFIYDNLAIQNNVIGAAWRHGVKKLLFLGSTCIYPRDCRQPMREEELLTGPLEYTNEPYAIAKIAGLKLCESFNLQYGTDFIAVMPTNLYGPNDNFDLERSHVLPALLRKMKLGRALEREDWGMIARDFALRPVEGIGADATRGEMLEKLDKYGVRRRPDGTVEVEIWGTGTPMREFLWSGEMADACVFLMERISFRDTFAPGDREIRNCHINIGTGEEISIADLARLVKERFGFGGELVFNASKPDGTPRKLTDPGKLNALGWRHRIGIGEGVERLATELLRE